MRRVLPARRGLLVRPGRLVRRARTVPPVLLVRLAHAVLRALPERWVRPAPVDQMDLAGYLDSVDHAALLAKMEYLEYLEQLDHEVSAGNPVRPAIADRLDRKALADLEALLDPPGCSAPPGSTDSNSPSTHRAGRRLCSSASRTRR